MKKSIVIIILGGLNILYSLAALIDSYEVIEGGGYSVSFNRDYLFWLINGIFILIIGIMIYKENKSLKNE